MFSGRDDKPLRKVLVADCGELKREVVKPAPKAVADAATASTGSSQFPVSSGTRHATGDQDEPPPAEEEEEEPAVDVANMTERERKLYALKSKLKEARRANRQQTAQEHKKLNDPKRQAAGENASAEHRALVSDATPDIREGMEAARDKDPARRFMHETAEVTEYRVNKRKSKNPAPFGWDVFNQDTLYRAYEKRALKLETDAPAVAPESFRDANALDFVNAPVSEAAVDRMVAELQDTHQRRSKFSRRRPYWEAKDVDYISERNRVFVKKVDRAFGKHTAEIKLNLERGTAL